MVIVKAVYDAEHQLLQLDAPLEGFRDGEKVSVIVHHIDPERPWLDLRGALSGEDGERFAKDILLEPVEGFGSHETVSVTIQHEVTPEDVPKRPWTKFRGILKGEDAESFGRAIDEAFPIDPVHK
jgi:hypothetical protein